MQVALIISENVDRRKAIAAALADVVVPVEIACREGIYDMEKLHRGNIALVYLDACFVGDEFGKLVAPSHIANLCGRTTYGPFVIGACATGEIICPGIYSTLHDHGLQNSDKITIVPFGDNLAAAVHATLSVSC